MTEPGSLSPFQRTPVLAALLGGALLGILLLLLELRMIAAQPLAWEATSLLALFATGAPWYLGSHLVMSLMMIALLVLVRNRTRGESARRLEPAPTVVWTLTWLLFFDLFFIFSATAIQGDWRAPLYVHLFRELMILALVALATLIPVLVLGARIRSRRWRLLTQLCWVSTLAFVMASWLQRNQTELAEGGSLLRPGLLPEIAALLTQGVLLSGIVLLAVLAVASVLRRTLPSPRWSSLLSLAALFLTTLLLTVTLWIGIERATSGLPLSEAPPQSSTATVNVIEIVVDTLGAKYVDPDRLQEFPAFRRLANDGIQFTQAYATGALTSASVPGILTARLDFLREQPASKLRFLRDEEVTTAEVMKGLGYQTIGFSANPVVSATFNYDQGFDYFSSENETSLFWFYFLRALGTLSRRALYEHGVITSAIYYTDAGALFAKVEKYLRTGGHLPFFLYLQFMDPHGPYLPDREYLEDDFSFDDFITYSELLRRVANRTTLEVPPQQRERAFQRYKAELRYTDHQLSKLLDLLLELGLYDETLIIVTADHGEEWWEHGSALHGHSLYDELIRVPLLVKFPRTWKCGEDRTLSRQIHSQPVSTLDILPTIIDTVAEGELSESLTSRLEGRALGPLLCRQDDTGDRVIQGASMRQAYVIRGDWKLIYMHRERQYELYNLKRDPEETTNLLATEVEAAQSLRAILDSFILELKKGQRQDDDLPELPADVEERLRTLGYVD